MPAATATARSRARKDLQHFGSPPMIPTASSDHSPSTSQRCCSGQSASRQAGWSGRCTLRAPSAIKLSYQLNETPSPVVSGAPRAQHSLSGRRSPSGQSQPVRDAVSPVTPIAPDEPLQARLTEMTEMERAKAMARFAVLRPFLDAEISLARAAAGAGVSIRTAQRWLARYRANGLPGLVRHPRMDAGRRKIAVSWRSDTKRLADIVAACR